MPPSSLEFQNLSDTTSHTLKLFQGTLCVTAPSSTYFPAPDRPRDTPRCAYISRVSGHGRLHCTREARAGHCRLEWTRPLPTLGIEPVMQRCRCPFLHILPPPVSGGRVDKRRELERRQGRLLLLLSFLRRLPSKLPCPTTHPMPPHLASLSYISS